MGDLINKGKPGKAARYVLDPAVTDADKADANFWFMAFKSSDMIGEHEAAKKYAARARTCTNYSPTMEGDFHRDAAIAAIKRGEFDVADEELRETLDLHLEDANREAAIDMVEGRLAYARRDLARSLQFHIRAEETWNAMKANGDSAGIDWQWYLNNRYHRLRTATEIPRHAIVREDYSYVRQNAKDPRQRVGSWFARWLGRPGNILFDRVIERIVAIFAKR